VVGRGVRKSGEGVVWKTKSTSNFRFFAQKLYTKVCFANCMNVLAIASGLSSPFRNL
jgi:hypothetical protein